MLRFVQGNDCQVELMPWGSHDWISREGLTEADQLILVRVTMPAGKAHKFHRHPEMEEIIYVLFGQAEQWVEEDSRLLGAGESAHIPMNMVHGTYNPGISDLVFLAILSPAKIEGPALVDVAEESPWVDLKPME